MNDIIIFAGPSIRPGEVARVLPQAEIRPPAAMGDIYRALASRPRAIGIIDGYFERVPAPWHKEILWALNQGVAVFGAASMGALRAVELAPFGMVGVGQVVSWFGAGLIEDDDEVAVAHLGPDDEFRPMTEAMVNIRGTLSAAEAAEVITADEAATIIQVAKGLYYTERTWPAIGHGLRERGLFTHDQVDRIVAWVRDHRVDVKGNDARQLLATIDEWVRRGEKAAPPSWHFEHTLFWEEARQEIAAGQMDSNLPMTATELDLVLDELRLSPKEHGEVYNEALVRVLASAYADARSFQLRPEETQAILDERRQMMGLFTEADVRRWLADEELSVDDLHGLITVDSHVAWVNAIAVDSLGPAATDVLRLRRRYSDLVARARAKHAALGEDWRPTDTEAADQFSEEELLHWWFGEVLGEEFPDGLDAYLARHRIASRAEFITALRREYAYRAKSAITRAGAESRSSV